jgi:hypothetical protein
MTGVEAALGLPRPEMADGLTVAFLADMIAGRPLESREKDFSDFVK